MGVDEGRKHLLEVPTEKLPPLHAVNGLEEVKENFSAEPISPRKGAPGQIDVWVDGWIDLRVDR